MKDFYYILGVDTNCSSIEIKEAYRKLSKKFHPDVNQNDKYFESRFREIHEAYVILNDPAQRAIYDRNLKKFKAPPSSGRSSSQQQQRTHKPQPGAYYQARPAASYKVNPRRSIDVLFTIILIGITIIFGDYVYKALTYTKPPKASSIPTVTAVSYVPTVKHHKRKRNFKTNLYNEVIPKVSADIATVPPAQPVVAKPTIIQPAPKVENTVKDYLYATNIRSNLTGVTNMHESERFSSPVIKEIPNHSQVLVLEKGGSYYKVRFSGEEGYVPKWTVMDK